MQVPAGKSVNKDARKVRKPTVRGNIGKKKNGGAEAGGDPAGIGGVGLHLLASQLRTLPIFEVAMLRGDKRDNYDRYENAALIKTIDTEAKQLQAIEDLYAIVKAQPQYEKLNEPSWKADTEPTVVIYWLLRKLSPLAKGNSWTVDTYVENHRTRYRFVVYKPYNSQLVKYREEHFALDFLPMLKPRDLQMHDLIIDIVALVSRENNLPLWDEDGDYSEFLKDLLTVPPGGYSVYTLEKQHQVYSVGPAAQYLNLIKERREVVTVADIYEQLRNYDPSSGRKQSFAWWIKIGLDLVKGKGDIRNNTYIANYLPGTIITPFQLYKFVWSKHSCDVVNIRAKRVFDKRNWQLPIRFSITKPGQIVQPLGEDQHPVLLYDFMSFGVELHMWRHREYYYKKDLESKEPPAVRFLEQLEIAEIQNESR